jgi:hypothetical protein
MKALAELVVQATQIRALVATALRAIMCLLRRLAQPMAAAVAAAAMMAQPALVRLALLVTFGLNTRNSSPNGPR